MHPQQVMLRFKPGQGWYWSGEDDNSILVHLHDLPEFWNAPEDAVEDTTHHGLHVSLGTGDYYLHDEVHNVIGVADARERDDTTVYCRV